MRCRFSLKVSLALVMVAVFLCSLFNSSVAYDTPLAQTLETSSEAISDPDFQVAEKGVSPNVVRVLFKDDFETTKGWTLDSAAQWGIGTATYRSANSSSKLLGNNLPGYGYPTGLTTTSYATSPKIDCTGAMTALLFFYQMPMFYYGDSATIDAFDGTNWVTIWAKDPAGYIYNYTWRSLSIDVSTWARNNANFKIRFGLGPTGTTYSGYYGWTVDDFFIMDTTPVPVSIAVSAPATGETWHFGASHYINWTINDGAPNYKVNISLSIDGGTTYPYYILKTDQSQSKKGNGYYLWLVPTGPVPNSTMCKVKVRVIDADGAGTTNYSESPGLFTICSWPPTVNLKDPSGGQKWYTGQTYKINWTVGGMWWGKFNLDFFLSTDGGLTFSWVGNITKPSGPNSFDWSIPMSISPSTLCRIKINASGGGSSDEDISKNNFTIEKSIYIHLLSPVGGEVWLLGETHDIQWTLDNGTAPYNVDIKLATDGVVFSTTLAAGLVQNASGPGSFSWKISTSLTPSKNCKIKILAKDAVKQSSLVSGVFELNETPVNPVQASVVSPNGGEVLFLEDTVPVKWFIWEGKATYTVDVWLKVPGDSVLIAAAQTQGVKGTGSYDWYIDPNTFPESTSCKIFIEVYDSKGHYFNDTSNGTFTICPKLTVKLDAPVGAEIWDIPSKQSISWTISGGNAPYDYSVRLSTDSGVSYSTTLTSGSQASAGVGSYAWDIPASTSESDTCRIQINITQGTGFVSDSCPSNFALKKAIIKLGNLSGTLKCAKTEATIGDASVYLNMSGFYTLSNPGGIWTLNDIPVGSYTLYIGAKGYVNYSQPVTVQAFKTVDIGTIKLAPIGLITGKVVDKDTGAAIVGVFVKVTLRSSTFTDMKETANNGTFIFSAMPLGTYDVTIDLDGYRNYTGTAKLTSAGPVNDLSTIQMEEINRKAVAALDATMIILILVILLVIVAIMGIAAMRYKKKKAESKKGPLQFVYPVFTLEQAVQDGRMDQLPPAQEQGYYGDDGQYYSDAGYQAPPTTEASFGYDSPPAAPEPYVPYEYSEYAPAEQASVAPVAAVTAPSTDDVDYDGELAKYVELRDSGALSEEEYEYAKKNLLKKKFEASKKKLN